MKTKLCVLLFLLMTILAQAQTNDLTALLQQGLMEEQASQNLEAAIASYQSLARQFDKNRQLAGTAVFRIGECYRMQGKTNEAAAQYQRILKDFSDQSTLATLSRQNLSGMGMATPAKGISSDTTMTAAQNSDVALWNKLKDSKTNELEKILPTLVPDATLDRLLQQRNETQAKIAELQTNYAPLNPTVASQKALLEEINRQISQKISGMMLALKMRAEIAQHNVIAGSPQNSEARTTDEEDQEIRRIQQMIQNSPDLINAPGNTPSEQGITPLVRAASAGWLKVAAYLLDHGADVNARGGSALILATIVGNRAMVEFLLSHGANVNSKCETTDWVYLSQTPLQIAVQKGFQAVVEVLLANKADVNVEDNSGNTALSLAAKNNQTKIVKMLLAASAKPNQENKDGRTPLSFAAGSGSSEIVKMLLDAKADPNSGNLNAPLLVAIHNNDVASVELLLKDSANPNAKGNVDWEINYGGSLHNANSYPHPSITPLFLAVSTVQLPMVQLLLKYKADPNDSETDDRPLLFYALSDPNIVQALLDAGGKIDSRQNGWSLLHSAVTANNFLAVQTLLKNGANANDPISHGVYPDGYTPLHMAANQLDDQYIFQLLIDYHADPNVRGNDGKTPLDLLKNKITESRSVKDKATASVLADFLRQHGALDKLPDWDRITVSRPSSDFSEAVFYKGTNDWNQFTLLETILRFYDKSVFPSGPGSINSKLPFPDLAHIVILRPSRNSTNMTRIEVNLLNSTNGIDCAKDVPLQFGDVTEVPVKNHALGDPAIGLNDIENVTIVVCLKGNVKLLAGGQKVELPIYLWDYHSMIGYFLQGAEAQKKLLSSSDLSRIKVIRSNVKTGKNKEWILDCSNQQALPNLWLRDGDVIEVPEKP